MGKSAGAAPDYKGAAEQTAQSGQQNINAQTLANRPNTSGPFSFQNWNQGPDGSWQLNSGLSGGLGNAMGSLSNQAGQSLGQQLDPSLFNPVGNGDAARDQAITGAYNQATSRLDPQFAKRDEQTRAQLANQGLDPNSQAARSSMAQLGRDRNDAYGSAMNSAIGQGTQAGQAVFGEDMQAHQQALADALQQRNAPLSEISQLSGLAQGGPQFNQAGVAAPTDFSGATAQAGNWQMQDAQMRNQFWGDLAGGLTGLAGSAAKFSDARLKENIVREEEEALPGVPYATWNWKGRPEARERGVIAQDVACVLPHLVHLSPEGFLMVDYSQIQEA